MTDVTEHLPIFVYGTLQRGEERERNWPRMPTRIEWATLRAQLRDLGDYPAIIDGDDLVLGELWHVAEADLPLTLETLDEIEGYADSPTDLYIRSVVECTTLTGERRRCHTYFFAQPADIALAPIVLAGPDGFCHWRASNRCAPPR